MKEVFSILIVIMMILALNAAAYAEMPAGDGAVGFIDERGSFTDSHAADGGAIYAAGSDPVIKSSFTDSQATVGGAICPDAGGAVITGIFIDSGDTGGGTIYAE